MTMGMCLIWARVEDAYRASRLAEVKGKRLQIYVTILYFGVTWVGLATTQGVGHKNDTTKKSTYKMVTA